MCWRSWRTPPPGSTSAPANPSANLTHYPPRNYQEWAEYVATVVSRYKDDIHYWEVWNEPDLAEFWNGTPAQYAALLALTYATIKQIDPTATVVVGGQDNAADGSLSIVVGGIENGVNTGGCVLNGQQNAADHNGVVVNGFLNHAVGNGVVLSGMGNFGGGVVLNGYSNSATGNGVVISGYGNGASSIGNHAGVVSTFEGKERMEFYPDQLPAEMLDRLWASDILER